MIKRLLTLTLLILTGLVLMAILAHLALSHWQQGLAGQRLGQFAEVAEQIRSDVNRKLDHFLTIEQNRPYTDYLPVHVPFTNNLAQQQSLIVRSPLVGHLSEGLAYGHFQLHDNGNISTPNDEILSQFGQNEMNVQISSEIQQFRQELQSDLLPALHLQEVPWGRPNRQSTRPTPTAMKAQAKFSTQENTLAKSRERRANSKALAIETFQQQAEPQIMEQELSIVNATITSNLAMGQQEFIAYLDEQAPDSNSQTSLPKQALQASQEQTVTIQVQPFTPIIIPSKNTPQPLFSGPIYLVRHVMVEQNHFMQGFRLNQQQLKQEIEQSAQQFIRDGMGFMLDSEEDMDTAFSAVLDFGFGDVLLDLIELDPGWISTKALWLRRWYFGALGIVGMAVALGLFSLWQGTREQLALVRQKDNFISAVSHELRTPLTSIRMYAEMLEKGWVKDDGKQTQYHANIRQESERLSRLIENVLDFSRLQRGRKNFRFELGDLNACVTQVVDMMTPYAQQQGCTIVTECGDLPACTYDQDALTQIIVNLLDNAIKYGRNPKDPVITLRTYRNRNGIIIEVEDHGPGVPSHQHKKIFQEFYRTEDEATRETTGTGLGLALVKRFAEAHTGFAEVLQAQPQGALFRVGIKPMS